MGMQKDNPNAIHTETRKMRIQMVENTVKERDVMKKKLLALTMLQFNTSRRTTLEYINVLIDAEIINEKDGILSWIQR